MKITKQKYDQIKTKADKLTLKELAKKYGVGVTTAWKVRNTNGYEEFQGLNYRYYQNSKYKDLMQTENLRRANFKVALIGVVIMAVAVIMAIICG